MKIGKWAWILLMAASSLAGCKGFWDAPVTGSFALTNSASISVSSGTAGTGTSTITVTPSNSFTGTVTLACAVTTSISSPTSPATCSLNPASVSITDTSAQTSTLTATTTATTTAGIYNIKVTGSSNGVNETTTVCLAVGSATCTTTASNSGSFYVLNQGTKQLVAYNITSDNLTSLGADTLPSLPYSLAASPVGGFVYVSTLSGIYLYTTGSNGALTLSTTNAGQVSTDAPYAIQVDPTGSWLVEAIPVLGGGSVVLNAYAISSTGTLESSNYATTYSAPNGAVQPQQLVISPDKTRIFVAMGSGGTLIVPFSDGAATANPLGASGTIITPANGGQALSVAVDPSSTPGLLYIGETLADNAGTSGGLRVFYYNSLGGVLAQVSGSPFASGGLAPTSILPLSGGNYVFVANGAGPSTAGVIAEFSVANTGTTASPVYSVSTDTTISAGIQPAGLAEDSTGSYVLTVDSGGSPDFEAYTMSSGTLTSVLSDATGSDPVQASVIVAAP